MSASKTACVACVRIFSCEPRRRPRPKIVYISSGAVRLPSSMCLRVGSSSGGAIRLRKRVCGIRAWFHTHFQSENAL